MSIADRLAIAAIAVALGLIGVFVYVASAPPASWVDVLVVQFIFATLYVASIRGLHTRRRLHRTG